MNALVKKEIRLLLPSGGAAVLLAMVQAITQPFDFYVAWLMFFGLAIMALTTMGREASLNTFSLLLAQPAERIRVWSVKLTVLAAAFLIVLMVWLVALGIALSRRTVIDASDPQNRPDYLFYMGCFIAMATFTGGLWTTLLLRQLAGAFWLTLLVPATLSAGAAIFVVNHDSDHLMIAVLSVVIGLYSLGGFFWARWLFFRAQDVGWSGGVIVLPDWSRWMARRENAVSRRRRAPLRALIGKELQLHQVSLLGAAGLLIGHIVLAAVRAWHNFNLTSTADSILAGVTELYWIVWLVLAPVIGSMAVAEERRLGVMAGQFCQPVSRRVQFVIKALVTLALAILLGGVVPVLVELTAAHVLGGRSVFTDVGHLQTMWGVLAFAAGLALVSFFASTLARSFLQAMGMAVATLFVCATLVPVLTDGRILFTGHGNYYSKQFLPLAIGVPTVMVVLLWLAYLNFNQYREGWPLWRRNLLGLAGAVLFSIAGSNALYHRVWEVFEPAEPVHGPAKLSLANPPELRNETYGNANLLVRLPDGRVWFDYLSNRPSSNQRPYWWSLVAWIANPLLHSAGPRAFIAGTNWLDASARHVDEVFEGTSVRSYVHLVGYADTVGIQKDGTLWASDHVDATHWEPAGLRRVGEGTNWVRFVRGDDVRCVILLKQDGTLWCWKPDIHFDWGDWPGKWPGLQACPIRQIGADADWVDVYWMEGYQYCARKADGSFWRLNVYSKTEKGMTQKASPYDPLNQVLSGKYSRGGGFHNWDAYVRPDGALWLAGQLRNYTKAGMPPLENAQCGHETYWVAVANSWDWMVAIKNDGTLWQWSPPGRGQGWWGFQPRDFLFHSPVRLGIHEDWISIVAVEGGVVLLAADGSLWFWPDPSSYSYQDMVLELPKQPQLIGKVLE